MKRWPTGICALLCGLVAGCSPDRPANFPAPQPRPVAVAGAWAPADSFSPDVQEAARFAVQAFAVQNKARVLYKDVSQARQQVVAGMNFELHLQVTLNGKPRNAKAVVWRQLEGAYSLQSWDWLD